MDPKNKKTAESAKADVSWGLPAFGPGEQRLIRTTVVMLSAVTLAGLIVFIIWVLGRVLSALQVLILPLAVAGVLALVLYPVVEFLQRRFRMSRVSAVTAIFVAMFLLLITMLIVVIPTAIDQVSRFSNAAPGMAQQAYDTLSTKAPGAVDAMKKALADGHLQAMLPEPGKITERAFTYVGIIVGLGFVPLYVFFALIAGNRLRDHAEEVLSLFSRETRDEVLYLGQVFVSYLTAFFRGQLLIALLMGIMLAVGFTLIGLQAAIAFGLALGLLNIVPYLGVIIGLITVLPVAYIQPAGGIEMVGMVLAVFIVVQLIESFLLTPKIMAGQSGLHPVLVVISILFWGIALGGIIGMILAIPLTAFLITLWKHTKGRMQRMVSSSDTGETLS